MSVVYLEDVIKVVGNKYLAIHVAGLIGGSGKGFNRHRLSKATRFGFSTTLDLHGDPSRKWRPESPESSNVNPALGRADILPSRIQETL